MRLPLHFLLPAIKGIPVLMYHKVWEGGSDRLTIDPALLEQHFQYLKDKGYRALSLPEFLAVAKGERAAEPRSFLLTFDDGCQNNLTKAYPMIKAFGFKATFFIIGNTLDGTAAEETGQDRKLSVEELRGIDANIVQLALHSYGHISFSATAPAQIRKDMRRNIDVLERSGLAFHKVLAYPYGARPKGESTKKELKQWMQQHGITAAFRIGNQPCRIPVTDILELKRIDIWGTDTVKEFGIKLKKGKLNLF